MRRASELGILGFAILLMACSGSAADVAGGYAVSLTNRENGCNSPNWVEGETTNNVPIAITQSGKNVTGTVQGLWGTSTTAVLGSATFTGRVSGRRIDMTLFGTVSTTLGNCTYTVNAELEATVSGDFMTGEVRYTPATNGNPDCSVVEGCVSRQEFNGTRPPQ